MFSRETQALMEAAADAIVVIDQHGTMTAVNGAAQKMFGFRTDELLGENVQLLMPEPDRTAHSDYLRRYLATGVAGVIGNGRDVIAKRKSGENFPARVTVGQIPHCKPPQFVGFVRDNTAQVRQEENARLAQERFTSVARLATLGEMAAGIAHELSQPLTAINAYACASEHFMSMPQPDLAELRDAMREISAEALRAGAIIRRMRQLVRIEPVEHVALDPTALLEDLKILISADARINGVDVAYAFATKGCHVLADGVQLQQLVLNLLRNAFEALAAQPAGSRRVEVASSVLADGNLEISITDNGPGVSSAIADRLFEPFCTTKPGGTGLGLAISRTIAQAHRGSVGYRAAAPHGTCFYVRLPAVEDSAK